MAKSCWGTFLHTVLRQRFWWILRLTVIISSPAGTTLAAELVHPKINMSQYVASNGQTKIHVLKFGRFIRDDQSKSNRLYFFAEPGAIANNYGATPITPKGQEMQEVEIFQKRTLAPLGDGESSRMLGADPIHSYGRVTDAVGNWPRWQDVCRDSYTYLIVSRKILLGFITFYYATPRDNRTTEYSIYMLRSTDGIEGFQENFWRPSHIFLPTQIGRLKNFRCQLRWPTPEMKAIVRDLG